jgi:hypothetical protein
MTAATIRKLLLRMPMSLSREVLCRAAPFSCGLLLQREANHVAGGCNVRRQATVRKQALPDKVTKAVPLQTLPTSVLSRSPE